MSELLRVIYNATQIDLTDPFTFDTTKTKSSLCERVARIALFIFLSIVSQGIVTAFCLGVAYWKEKKIQKAEAIIEKFWKEHIQAFKFWYGTSALYYTHFKKHGISATYPVALQSIIKEIREIWTNHQYDVLPKTSDFLQFEHRYENARKHNKVEVDFAANCESLREYTFGERTGGGEWMYEVRRFLSKAARNIKVFSEEECQTLTKIDAFVKLLLKVPPMTVAINGGSSYFLRGDRYFRFFGPLPKIIALVKESCPAWTDPIKLKNYLDNVLMKEFIETKSSLEKRLPYLPIRQPIPSDQLEFAILPQLECPRLEFDCEVVLSSAEMFALNIDLQHFSSHEEYQDSRFNFTFRTEGEELFYYVTRQRLSEQDNKHRRANLAEIELRRKTVEEILKGLGSEFLLKYAAT